MNPKLDHLIIVAGNSVLTNPAEITNLSREDARVKLRTDDAWILKPREKNRSVPVDLIRHIEEGVNLFNDDPLSVLVFSGGATRGPTEKYPDWNSKDTEAESYCVVAKKIFDVSRPHDLLIDIHSYNSAHNVLFGLNEFCNHTGQLPRRLSIVTRDFKEERFEIYIEEIQKIIGATFEYTFVGVPDSNQEYGKDSRKYERIHQIPGLKKNRGRDYEELLPSRKSESQPKFDRAICPKLKPMIDTVLGTT